MSDRPGHPAAQEEPWTVLRLLEWTTNFFRQRGSESPRLDAEILLAHARGCRRIELYTAFAEQPGEEQRVAFREMVRRRGEGMPVAQLVGYREFYSLRFRVNEEVLIPRPETEHLVIEALDVAKSMAASDQAAGDPAASDAAANDPAASDSSARGVDSEKDLPLMIADIGTGSGAIAVTLAKNLPVAQITAVDRSANALKIAAWNAAQHHVSENIRFVESDLLSAVETPSQFDIICSNPPYVSTSEFDQLSKTIQEYEPREALVSGPKGTEVIERIVHQAPDRLRSGGRLIVELSPMIADACLDLVKQTESFTDERFVKDLDGHRRILSAQRV